MLKKALALLTMICLLFSMNMGLTSAETLETENFKDATPLKFEEEEFNLNLSFSTAFEVLKDEKDAKYYSINLEKSGLVSFSMDQNVNIEYGITLYDVNGNVYEDYYTYKGDEVEDIFNYGLAKGTYYVKVYVNDGTGQIIPFKLEVMRWYGNTIEKELNNTIETATPISLGTNYAGFTDQAYTKDIYCFKTTKKGFVGIKGSYSPDAKLNYSLMNDKGVVLKKIVLSEKMSDENVTVFASSLPAGTYYLSVSQTNGDYINLAYLIETQFINENQFEKESNNSIKQANVISANTAYSGLIKQKSDKDFYKFYVGKNKTFTLNFNRLEETTFKVNVLNSKGKIVKSFTTKKGDESFSKLGTLNLTKGTYFLDVELLQSKNENVIYNFSLK
ncbi:hypothetical protein [Bacillus sp. EAC]|uniref:hypothetical protein n=1 Tax=Bacillus sp. EAC TaxID=1978338 RepID=UPI000B4425F1|nr:hypothetical protein [Bacillus sp. EAC]